MKSVFCFNKRTECEPLPVGSSRGAYVAVANAANKQCSTASMSASMTGRRMTGAIGAAVQLVYNNNNKLIAQQGKN